MSYWLLMWLMKCSCGHFFFFLLQKFYNWTLKFVIYFILILEKVHSLIFKWNVPNYSFWIKVIGVKDVVLVSGGSTCHLMLNFVLEKSAGQFLLQISSTLMLELLMNWIWTAKRTVNKIQSIWPTIATL